MDSNSIVNELNSLVKTCKDGEYGFQSCAEHAISRALRELFSCRSADCRRSAAELQAMVRQFGCEPEDSGTTFGTARRQWITFRSAVFNYDDMAILEECKRGEEAALARYRSLLSDTLPGSVLEVVLRQYEGARRNHEHLCSLCNRNRQMANRH